MKTSIASPLLLCLLTLLPLSACQQQEQPAAEVGRVEANQAYLDYFGAPPQAKEGRAYARLAYLPLRQSPEKLGAVPLFLYSDQKQLAQILGKLISGTLVLPPQSRLYQPYPQDLQLQVTALEKRTLEIALETAHPWAEVDLSAGLRAITATASQFAEVERVRVQLNGQPVAQQPAAGLSHDPQQVLAAGPPSLLLLAASWEKGAAQPEELLVYFDRPVTVNRFQLDSAAGEKVSGDYFTSVFNMAVVIHPHAAGNYQPGQELRVVWDVTDALGRSNHGEDRLPLQYQEH